MTTQTEFPALRSRALLAALEEDPTWEITPTTPQGEAATPGNLLEYLKVTRQYRNPTWTGVNAHMELQQVWNYIYQHGVDPFHRTVADVMRSHFGTLRDIEEVFHITRHGPVPAYLFVSDAYTVEMTLGEVDVLFADTRTLYRARISEVDAFIQGNRPWSDVCPFPVLVLTV